MIRPERRGSLLSISAIACVAAACGGRVQGPGGPGGGGPGGRAIGGAGGGGVEGMDSPDDAGASDDGWNGSAANTSTGSEPVCNEAPPACGSLAPAPTSFGSAQDAADAIVGRWAFCPGGDTSGFYPPDQVGEEFAPDGTYYQLVADSSGQLVRNADPRTVGTWEVKLAPKDAVEVHTYGNGVQRPVDLSACPRALDALGLEVPAP